MKVTVTYEIVVDRELNRAELTQALFEHLKAAVVHYSYHPAYKNTIGKFEVKSIVGLTPVWEK